MKAWDKDFDRLFQSKLDDIEVEPSAMVWDNIIDELDGKIKKKMGLPWMRIAATIVVMMGASLLFLRPDAEKVTLRGTANTELAATPSAGSTASGDMAIGPENVVSDQISEPPVKHSKKQALAAAHKSIPKADSFADTIQSVANINITQPEPQNIKTVTAMAQHPISVVDERIQLPANLNHNGTVKPVNMVPVTIIQPEEPVKKKKIRGLGDILNAVIAKVDKRHDKVIEFANTDEDDSFIIKGVNLGLLKVKKEN